MRTGHRDEWDYTGATGDQLDGPALSRPPDKPSAEWAPELDRVSQFKIIDEEWGDFAARQAVYGQFDLFARPGTGDGVRADCLMSVG